MTALCGTLRDATESYLGQEVGRAVITYPEYLYEATKSHDLTAACGSLKRPITVEQQVRRSTSAALAYGLHKLEGDEWYLAVVDTDGGLSVSINAIEDGVFDRVGVRYDPLFYLDAIHTLLDEALANSIVEYHNGPLRRSDIREILLIGPRVTDELRQTIQSYFGWELETYRVPSAEHAPVLGAARQIKWLTAEPDIVGRNCPCGGHGEIDDEL